MMHSMRPFESPAVGSVDENADVSPAPDLPAARDCYGRAAPPRI
jgi:hypothetical protein